MRLVLVTVTLLGWISLVFTEQEKILFQSGLSFETVDESTLSPSDKTDVADPKSTGSYLFNAKTIDPSGDFMKRLTLNIFIKDFKSPSSDLFRVHPTFLECLQKIVSDLASQKYKLVLESGFKTASDASAKLQDQYARAGTGAVLKFRQDTPGDILLIAKSALLHCPSIFEDIHRDIGLVIQADSVHIHMTGTSNITPHYSSDGYTKNSVAFKAWCLDQIDAGLAPTPPDCSSFTGLNSGAVYPDGKADPVEVVGAVDEQITREMTEDFARLVQFPGRVIYFENTEASSSWCGKAGTTCRQCDDGIYGSALDARCADRVMSPRMYLALNKLQKLVRDNMANRKLKVIDAWSEPTSAKPAGAYPADSLHVEGRMVKASVTGPGAAAQLKELSKYAICAGIDHVKHAGKDAVLELSVRKQSTRLERKVAFPEVELLEVTPPTSKMEYYKLPETYGPEEIAEMPLFDSDNQDDVDLCQYSTIKKFKSQDPEFRYFRLHPRIPECYMNIQYEAQKGTDKADVEIVRGYLTDTEQKLYFDPLFDKRFNTHILGQALEIKWADGAPEGFTKHMLAEIAVDQCAKPFYESGQQMGVGIYENSVYIDFRDEFEVWVEETNYLPPGMDLVVYEETLAERFLQAVENRLINPDDKELVCSASVPPQPQSHTYEYRTTPAEEKVAADRRRRRAAKEECVPSRATDFCTQTKEHRENEVALLWKEITRKHLFRDPEEVKAALDGCFGDCGTCLEGEIWEDKVKHCSNLFHWVPFDTLNTEKHQSNFFSRDNLVTKMYACDKGEHCVNKSPLFSIFAPSIERIYRPDPKASVKEELYGSADNPSPAFDLINRIYAYTAVGDVKIWVKDEADITSMRSALEVLMVFNKNVTDVKVFVTTEVSRDAVNAVLENMANEWTTTTCPDWSRQYVAPFDVTAELPAGITKRDVRYDIHNEMLHKARNWERDWIDKHFEF